MIDVSELRALIKNQQQPLTDIEQIFGALLGYPDREAIENPTRADLTGALDAACEALIGDKTEVPRDILDVVRDTIVDGKTTYDDIASLISANPAPWHAKIERAFAAQGSKLRE